MERKESWSVTENRFVCFLDIMGFKDMVMRNSHKHIYELLYKFSKQRETLDKARVFPEGYEIDSLKTVSFSDSIVIFTKTDSIKCFELLTLSVSWLFAKAMEAGIAMKGAVAHGETSFNESRQIFFGQTIIDAYLLEEDAAFYGILVHDTCEKYISDNEKLVSPFVREKYIDCKPILKSGKISHLILDWTASFEKADRLDFKDNAILLMRNQRMRTSGSPRRYIDNTVDVVNQLYKK